MTDAATQREFNLILRDLADELDVPPSKYQNAKDHYDAVGDWLGEDGSELAPFDPVIYPQGSFALGTAVRPLGDDDYDVDAVCLLQMDKAKTTQQTLKAMVGRRLKHPNSRYKDMLDPQDGGRRCWTIKYSDASKFHLDVLPAIPDDYAWLVALGVPREWAEHTICITDRETWDYAAEWPRSNPKGYVEWFKDRMRVRLDEAKGVLAMEKRADVQDIEDFEVRTPLQRLIQLLKRHRDLRYNGDDDKPVSIIITTLAGRAYNNEANLADAILNVVSAMRDNIECRNGVWWVPNPVNPHENFADKWAESPRKQRVFFEWLDAVEREHAYLLSDHGFEKVGEHLAESYGHRNAVAVMTKYAKRRGDGKAGASPLPIVLVPPRRILPDEASRPGIIVSHPSKPWGS